MAGHPDGSSYWRNIQGAEGGQPLTPPHNIPAWTQIQLKLDVDVPGYTIPAVVIDMMEKRSNRPQRTYEEILADPKIQLQSRISPKLRVKICKHLSKNEISWAYLLRDGLMYTACTWMFAHFLCHCSLSLPLALSELWRLVLGNGSRRLAGALGGL
jgi:hypothetical protein